LEAKHFDCERAMLAIPEGKTGAGTVPLLPNVIEAFRTYQAARPTGYTNKLFISVYGKGTPRGALQVAGVRQMIERRCAAVGIRRLNPHSFRHGLAMYLLNEKGADLSLVQGILRHSDVAITARHYARWTPEGLANTFADVMSD
ncbi:MAG: site-specific integrase, partial [Caldilineaceae bacterium]|nr:site-specific integrase [Caldilineaceae bacterium]